MKSRLAIILLFAALLAVVSGIAAFRSSGLRDQVVPPVIHPAVVRCAPQVEQTYCMTESFHGLIQANVRVDMAFQIPGRVSQLGASKDKPIKENDRVEPGQVLAQLEPLRYEAAVQEANAKMEEAKAALSTGEAQIADAKARLDDAKNDLERIKKMKEAGAANPREVEKAETAVKLADAQMESARAKLNAASAVYESARAMGTVANVNLQDATLKSPIRGLVAKVPVEIGQMVTPAQPIVTLVDLSNVKLVVGVVERKLPLLKKGQKVQVEVQALSSGQDSGEKLAASSRTGVITIVPPAAEPTTGLFNVEIELPNEDGKLRPGMIGKAVVAVSERKAIAIPADAATRVGDQYFAYFVGPGYEVGLNLGALGKSEVKVPTTIAHRVSFTPLSIDKDYYLVPADFTEGMGQLIVEGQTRLADGQTVRVIEPAVAQVETP
jgi:RND family efflux transporter MFP subunit